MSAKPKKKVIPMAGKRPTDSFENLVAKATARALQGQVQHMVAVTGQNILQKISRVVMKPIAAIETYVTAMKTVLDTKLPGFLAEVEVEVTNVEDAAWGYQTKTGPATEKDMLRVVVLTKVEGSEEYDEAPENLRIESLLQVNSNGDVQTYPELEAALDGKSAGDEVEVYLAPDKTVPENATPEQLKLVNEQKGFTVKVKVVKVSELKNKPEPQGVEDGSQQSESDEQQDSSKEV